MALDRTFARAASLLVNAVEAMLELADRDPARLGAEPVVARVRASMAEMDEDVLDGVAHLMMDVDELVDIAGAHGWGGTPQFEALDIARDEARAGFRAAMMLN